jgi:hypothetical protein
MQKMLVLLFAMAILLKPGLPVVEYVLNYDYIANELCINKDNKNLHCNGKCHLKSKLADASESADKNLPDKKSKPAQTEVLFCNAIEDLIPAKPVSILTSTDDRYSDLYTYDSCGRFFHPPSRT